MDKRGIISAESVIGIVIGVIIAITLFTIGSIVYRAFIKSGPDDSTLRTYNELVDEIKKLDDNSESEFLAQISEDYAIIGFNMTSKVAFGDTCYKSDQKTLFGGKPAYPTSYYVNITKPCKKNCLCLVKIDYFEKKIQQLFLVSEKVDQCYDFEDYDFAGFNDCKNFAVLPSGEIFGEKNIYPVGLKRENNIVYIAPRKYGEVNMTVSP